MSGRPSIFTDELAESICTMLSEGQSLRSICRRDDMPGLQTVMRWAKENEDFGNKYACAREAQAEFMDGQILDVADQCTNETAHADRVKIDAYKWRASKLAPKRYGEKVDLEGNIGVTVSGALQWQPPQS